MRFVVKTPRLIEQWIETDGKSIKFWYNDWREGGWYTPDNYKKEIASIYNRWKDENWLIKVCKAFSLNLDYIKNLARELKNDRIKIELLELKKAKSDINSQIKKLEKELRE